MMSEKVEVMIDGKLVDAFMAEYGSVEKASQALELLMAAELAKENQPTRAVS